MFDVTPIRLLAGSHADTGKTGLGCFMNVIAYLNGEPQITDASPCVCVTVKRIAIWLNDYMNDDERKQLLPFIVRAMGSTTMDKDTLVRRALLCADYAERRAARAARAAWYASAEKAAWDASVAWEASAASAARAARAARAAWYASAASAATFDYKAFRHELIADTIKLLDEMLPPASEPQREHIKRAKALVELVRA